MYMYYADHGYSTCVTCELGLSRKGRKDGWGRAFLPSFQESLSLS